MFDTPGKLYLGSEFDIRNNQLADNKAFVSAKDFTTHAVCLGMTGTGKTGLGIVALEEVLLQNTPCIIIDPKGDITNLALNFPEMKPADFERWLDEDEARRQGLSLEQLAKQTAQRWRDGLKKSDVLPDRLRDLSDRVKFEIYTPGSDAGIPINILQSLNPPSDPTITWTRHTETLRERISQVCSALLELVGVDADPMKSREHILLATIFESTWRANQPVSLDLLIRMIQEPPIQRIGAFDIETFYPRDDRFELAMAMNNLAASPSFASWSQGATLDIASLIKPDRSVESQNPMGKTRANIFYLAHLTDEERQFFVTLLLSQLVLWMRGQSGTSSLRCLVYFDEVFGYCPPFPRNPPTKAPLMSIIKQGRAAGLGVFLATQNPADLDYKGLANIGTWFIGRLRTGRDRDRALEGLEGAGAGFDRSLFEDALSTLPPRVFLLQSATGEPRFLQTRWAMSFLRGPMTRDQVAMLAGERKQNSEIRIQKSEIRFSPRPTLPPNVREVFLSRETPRYGSSAVYQPHLLASASVRITDRSSGVIQDERHTYLVPLDDMVRAPDFSRSPIIQLDVNDLRHDPIEGVGFAPMPSGVNERWLKQCEKLLVEHVYRFGVKRIFYNKSLRLYGQPDESALEFRQRCEEVAREKRNADAAKARAQFDRKMKALQDRLAREHRELSQDRAELSVRKREELLAGAEAVLNFVIGRRTPYAVAFGAQRRRNTKMAEQDVRESQKAIEQLELDLQDVAEEYKSALGQVSDKWMRALSEVSEVPLTPKKNDIFADMVALAWVVSTGANG
jgi:hypothetical protein